MTDPEAVRQRYGAAKSMVAALCSPRGSDGAREWLMSIPVRPDDPDLVITAALSDVPRLLAANAALAEALANLYAAYIHEFKPGAERIRVLETYYRGPAMSEMQNEMAESSELWAKWDAARDALRLTGRIP